MSNPLSKRERLKNIKALRPEIQGEILKHLQRVGNIDFNIPREQHKPVNFGLFAGEDNQTNLTLF